MYWELVMLNLIHLAKKSPCSSGKRINEWLVFALHPGCRSWHLLSWLRLRMPSRECWSLDRHSTCSRRWQNNVVSLFSVLKGRNQPCLKEHIWLVLISSSSLVHLPFVTAVALQTCFWIQVERSIIGGMVVDIGDKHIDLSIRSRIRKMEKVLGDTL